VLGRLAIESLVLRELDNDSPLAGDRLAGAAAAHAGARGRVGRARRDAGARQGQQAAASPAVDTRIGNFSLHQLKPLLELRTITGRARPSTTTARSTCATCRSSRSPARARASATPASRCSGASCGLRTLELPQSRISGAGLAHARQAREAGDACTILRRDPRPRGARRARRPAGAHRAHAEPVPPLADPTLAPLGRCSACAASGSTSPRLDDRAAPQLATLKQLEQLDLGGTQISDLGLKALAGLTELTELKLHHTRVTNRGLATSPASPSCERSSSTTPTSSTTASPTSRACTELRVLRLDKTLITDAALPHLLAHDRSSSSSTSPTPSSPPRASPCCAAAGAARRQPRPHPRRRADRRTCRDMSGGHVQAGSGGPASGRCGRPSGPGWVHARTASSQATPAATACCSGRPRARPQAIAVARAQPVPRGSGPG
jgi:hypothetical protein